MTQLPSFLRAEADKLVDAGHYGSRDEVVAFAVARLVERHKEEALDAEDKAAFVAAIEEGLADLEAGRTVSLDEACKEIRSEIRHRADAGLLARAAE